MEALSSVHMMRQARLSDALVYFKESQIKSPTASAYLSDLSIFASFLSEAGKADPYVAEIEARDVASFYDREAKTVSQATLRRRLCALRKFFSWAEGEGYATSNPAKSIKLPRVTEGERRCLTRKEAERLVAMGKWQDRWGARDRAILAVLYYTGIRVSELCTLDTGSVGDRLLYGKPGLRVARGKGGRERKIPLADPAAKEIRNWESKRHLAEPASPALFLNKFGERMTVRSVFDVVRKYAERAGLGSDVTPHTLRHTFATELARKKVGPKVIRDLMGHSSASMTLSYIHYTDEEYTGSVGVLE